MKRSTISAYHCALIAVADDTQTLAVTPLLEPKDNDSPITYKLPAENQALLFGDAASRIARDRMNLIHSCG